MQTTPRHQDLVFMKDSPEEYKGYYLQFRITRIGEFIFQALRELDPLFEVYDAETGIINIYTAKDSFKIKPFLAETKIIKQHQIFQMKSCVGAEYMVMEMKKLIDKYVKNNYKFAEFPKIPYIDLTIKQGEF